jgi:hypothetical protein
MMASQIGNQRSNLIQRKESFFSQLSTTIVVILVLILFVGVVGMCYQWLNNAGPYRTNLTGKILDKQPRFHETQYGSAIDWQIMIKEPDGKRVTVLVNEKTYQQAQIGQWLIKDGLKFTLSNQEPNNEKKAGTGQ